jgi:hypothetical protein
VSLLAGTSLSGKGAVAVDVLIPPSKVKVGEVSGGGPIASTLDPCRAGMYLSSSPRPHLFVPSLGPHLKFSSLWRGLCRLYPNDLTPVQYCLILSPRDVHWLDHVCSNTARPKHHEQPTSRSLDPVILYIPKNWEHFQHVSHKVTH